MSLVGPPLHYVMYDLGMHYVMYDLGIRLSVPPAACSMCVYALGWLWCCGDDLLLFLFFAPHL